jgi:hypothetical protein
MGMLSTPSFKTGSGSWPAATAISREAAMDALLAASCCERATARACDSGKVSGSAAQAGKLRKAAITAAAHERLNGENDMTTPDDDERSAHSRKVNGQRSNALECQIRKQQLRTVIGGAELRNREGGCASGRGAEGRLGSKVYVDPVATAPMGVGAWTFSTLCCADWQCAWHKPGCSVSITVSPAQGIPAATMAAA